MEHHKKDSLKRSKKDSKKVQNVHLHAQPQWRLAHHLLSTERSELDSSVGRYYTTARHTLIAMHRLLVNIEKKNPSDVFGA